jgi:NTP pyrophosphatase (non-canonical NTP hydrolase)
LNILYPALGLAGETGEVVEKVKKLFRDDKGVFTEERRQAIKKELGDVLAYLADLAADCKLTLSEIAKASLEKIHGRIARGTTLGNGDDR